MLTIALAQQIKEAGILWEPKPRDFFALPDHSLDDHIFVINYMTVSIGVMRGEPVVAFFGSTDMPLDYVPLSEAVWLPSEMQLRTILEKTLITKQGSGFQLASTDDGYCCQIQLNGETFNFDGFGVDEVYALALLHVKAQS